MDDHHPIIQEPVNVRRLPKRGTTIRHSADEQERTELAQRLDLLSIARLELMAAIKPWHRGGVEITGTIDAEYSQPCAVSGTPLDQTMSEEFRLRMVQEGSRLSRPAFDTEGELTLDPEGDDPPDTLSGDVINLGSVWEEFFTLGLDPFARAEDARLDDADEAPSSSENQEASPFAELARLKKH